MPNYTPDALEHIAAHLVDDQGNSFALPAGVKVVLASGASIDVPGANTTSDFFEVLLNETRAVRLGMEALLKHFTDEDWDLLELGATETDSDANAA